MQCRDLIIEGIPTFVESAQILRQRIGNKIGIDLGNIGRTRCRQALLDQVQQFTRIAICDANQSCFGTFHDLRMRQLSHSTIK